MLWPCTCTNKTDPYDLFYSLICGSFGGYLNKCNNSIPIKQEDVIIRLIRKWVNSDVFQIENENVPTLKHKKQSEGIKVNRTTRLTEIMRHYGDTTTTTICFFHVTFHIHQKGFGHLLSHNLEQLPQLTPPPPNIPFKMTKCVNTCQL